MQYLLNIREWPQPLPSLIGSVGDLCYRSWLYMEFRVATGIEVYILLLGEERGIPHDFLNHNDLLSSSSSTSVRDSSMARMVP